MLLRVIQLLQVHRIQFIELRQNLVELFMIGPNKSAVNKWSRLVENIGIWCWVENVRKLALVTFLYLLLYHKCHEAE